MKKRKGVMLADNDSNSASSHNLPGGSPKYSAHTETENCTGRSWRPRDMVAMAVGQPELVTTATGGHFSNNNLN